MEDKYNELKASGKTENECVGIVISEFGNIDELIKEMGYEKSTVFESVSDNQLTHEDVMNYLHKSRIANLLVGIGVFFCMMAPATLILLNVIFEVKEMSTALVDTLPLVALFLLIACGVALFISSDSYTSSYKFIKTGDFEITSYTENVIKKMQENYKPIHTAGILIGVLLCILAVLPLIILSNIYNTDAASSIGVFLLLFLIGIAVFLFIFIGGRDEDFKYLLHKVKTETSESHTDRVIGAVASVVFPLTAVAFLLWSFIGNAWNISWILWPIVGNLIWFF